jgi:hypothetical protein
MTVTVSPRPIRSVEGMPPGPGLAALLALPEDLSRDTTSGRRTASSQPATVNAAARTS